MTAQKKIFFSIVCVVSVLGFFLFGNSIFAWDVPTNNPPYDLVSLALNTGSTPQQKLGMLMVSDENGVIVNPGKVGVGTLFPEGLLTLVNQYTYLDVDENDNLIFSDASLMVDGQINPVTLQDLVGGGEHGDFVAGGNTAGDNRVLGNTNNRGLGFLTNGEERIRITGEGKVGIGLLNPQYLLTLKDNNTYIEVDGLGNLIFHDINSGSQSLAQLASLSAGDFNDGGDSATTPRVLGNKNDFDLGIITAGIDRIHITKDGRVGISSLMPAGLLGIGDNFTNIDVIDGHLTFTDTGLSMTLEDIMNIENGEFSDGGDAKLRPRTIGNTSGTSFGLKTSNQERITLASTGYVGIGAIAPQTNLDIAGAVRVGRDSSVCDTNKEGAMRWNGYSIEFCNGSIWNEVKCMSDCSEKGKECGSDGCGGSCGTCQSSLTCLNYACVCVVQTCQSRSFECGSFDGGCNGIVDCGSCSDGEVCNNNICLDNTPANFNFENQTDVAKNTLIYSNTVSVIGFDGSLEVDASCLSGNCNDLEFSCNGGEFVNSCFLTSGQTLQLRMMSPNSDYFAESEVRVSVGENTFDDWKVSLARGEYEIAFLSTPQVGVGFLGTITSKNSLDEIITSDNTIVYINSTGNVQFYKNDTFEQWEDTTTTDFSAGTSQNVLIDNNELKLEISSLSGTNHNGADWTPASGITITGTHYNIGTFTIVSGSTVNVGAGQILKIYAQNINIEGTLNGDQAGYTGGVGGAAATTLFATGKGGGGGGGSGAGENGSSGSVWVMSNITFCSGGGGGGGGASYGGLGNSGTAGEDGTYWYVSRAAGGGGGSAGAIYGTETGYDIDMGSGAGGGGGGGAQYSPSTLHIGRSGLTGGNGGAGILLNSLNTVSISGVITANGGVGGEGGEGSVGSGATFTGGDGGNAAGGSGGGILIDGADISLNGAVIRANGSSNGGGGRIKIFYKDNLSKNNVTYQVTGYSSGTVYEGTLDNSNYFISRTHDMGTSFEFKSFSWIADIPDQTGVKFQIATNNDNSTWNFVGPDGTASSFYTTSGQSVNSMHASDQYLRYKVYLARTNVFATPVIYDVYDSSNEIDRYSLINGLASIYVKTRINAASTINVYDDNGKTGSKLISF